MLQIGIFNIVWLMDVFYSSGRILSNEATRERFIYQTIKGVCEPSNHWRSMGTTCTSLFHGYGSWSKTFCIADGTLVAIVCCKIYLNVIFLFNYIVETWTHVKVQVDYV